MSAMFCFGFPILKGISRINMCTEFALLFHLLLIAIVGHCSEGPKAPITCDAGPFYVGESASVTCNFNVDMSKDGRAITVEWYPKNATTKIIGKEVFECKKKEPNQKRHCESKVNEYTFNGVINDRLTLDIPSVSENIAGLYTCFILPPTGTDPHVCTLTVKAGTRPADKQDETDESNTLWLIVLLIIPAVGVVLVLTVLRFRRKRKQNGQMDPLVMQPLIPGVGWQTALPANVPKKKIEELVKDFKLSTADCQRVMELLEQAMDADTADDTHPSVKMRPVNIRCLPEDIRDAAFLVVDFGSANLKIHLVKIQNKGHQSGVRSEHYTIPASIRLGTDTQLFEFIGDCIKTFVELHDLSDKRYRVGFVFSFPCEHKNDLTKARLIKWTKEFNCRGVEDRDPGELLQKVLVEMSKPDQLDVKTIVNDAMGSLIYGDRDATKCKMAVTLANGFHACCMQATPSSEKEHVNMVIMKTELGALGGNKSMYTSNTESDTDDCLKCVRTEYDIALDKYSINRGEQILEKMVSIMYLGEIVRLVLVKLTEKRLLFKSADHKSSDLHKRDCLNADHVSLIESDMSQDHFLTTFVLDKLQIKNCSDGDCRIVRYVCGVVSERAAHLAAAGLATLINRIGQPDITIAVDGPSLNIYHPHYHQHMHAKTKELVLPDLNFKIVSSHEGGARGAALVAAAVTQKPNKDKDKGSIHKVM